MTITVEFDPPQPGDSREVFNNKAFDTVAKLNPWSQQANALALEVNNDAATAEAGAEIVNSVVNFRGAWDDLTGALSVPASCAHASGYWILLESVADVTAHEPGVSAVWAMYESDFARLSGADFTGPITVPAGASGAQVPQAQETYGPKSGQLAGMRNKIINGAFLVNQRGYVSGTATTAGQYTLDRWKVTGAGGITFSTTNNKTTVTIPSGQTLQQVIEGLNLQTGTYVMSWEGTAQGRIDGGSYGASGVVTASITGGANTTIEFNTGTVANVQVEPGTIATPFEHRLYGAELALCQRYYEGGFFQTNAYVTGAGSLGGTVKMVPKIATPTTTATKSGGANTGSTVTANALSNKELLLYAAFDGTGEGYFVASWTASSEL